MSLKGPNYLRQKTNKVCSAKSEHSLAQITFVSCGEKNDLIEIQFFTDLPFVEQL